jgi:hypothetical protein
VRRMFTAPNGSKQKQPKSVSHKSDVDEVELDAASIAVLLRFFQLLDKWDREGKQS